MLRRLHKDQPDGFAFSPANQAWAGAQIAKYPEGRQASAIIPLLWRAQEQEGWLTRPAIEHVANMLGLAYMRALEVATFYFMFQLQPVGSLAHVQVCGTTSCMICGAEDLIAVCKTKIASKAHQISDDGRFSWEEVECLGACSNAPMVQIGKDFYEDLTEASFAAILDAFAHGDVPTPGPQNGRFASEPRGGNLTLVLPSSDTRSAHSASVTLALAKGDTVARILDESAYGAGSVAAQPAAIAPAALAAPEVAPTAEVATEPTPERAPEPSPAVQDDIAAAHAAAVASAARKVAEAEAVAEMAARPALLSGVPFGGADDLKALEGVGPKLESLLNTLGVYHFSQIAAWTEAEVAWMDGAIEGFPGCVSRDGWVDQAKILASGGETEFSARNKAGDA
jgi:NADH-quinone oxidoreductase subunit E